MFLWCIVSVLLESILYFTGHVAMLELAVRVNIFCQFFLFVMLTGFASVSIGSMPCTYHGLLVLIVVVLLLFSFYIKRLFLPYFSLHWIPHRKIRCGIYRIEKIDT